MAIGLGIVASVGELLALGFIVGIVGGVMAMEERQEFSVVTETGEDPSVTITVSQEVAERLNQVVRSRM